MGSFTSAITSAIETRINSCVLVGGGNLDFHQSISYVCHSPKGL
jgi:hypothetical protein